MLKYSKFKLSFFVVLSLSLSSFVCGATSEEVPNPVQKTVQKLHTPFVESASRGSIGLESRSFLSPDGLPTIDQNWALNGLVESDFTFGSLFKLKNQLSFKSDFRDPSRQVFSVDEFYLDFQKGIFEFQVGQQIFNWSSAEAFHPADRINARNFDGSFENGSKFGIPAVTLGAQLPFGHLQLGLLPMHFRPQFPGPLNRLSMAPTGFNPNLSSFIVDGEIYEKWDLDFKGFIKWSQPIGSSDLSLFALWHNDTSRSFVFNSFSGGPQIAFVEAFHAGMTHRWDLEGHLLKTEVIYSEYKNKLDSSLGFWIQEPIKSMTTVSFGYERSFEFSNGHELVPLLETQWVLGLDRDERFGADLFQRDLLVGARYLFNGLQSNEFRVMGIFDLERSKEAILSVSYEQRFLEDWKFMTSLRGFYSSEPQGPLEMLDHDGMLQVDVVRYF